jgi:hypothetical protein
VEALHVAADNHAVLMFIKEMHRMRDELHGFGRSYLEARLDGSGLPKK